MRYTVILRENSPGEYVAIAPAIPDCRAEGRTRHETLDRLRFAIADWLEKTEITSGEVPYQQTASAVEINPWLATAGIFADDPTLELMLREIYLERADEAPAT